MLESILESLYYPEMKTRSRNVSDAGTDTFEWIYEEATRRRHDEKGNQRYSGRWESAYEEDQVARSGFATNFRNWLEAADDRVFWITGKPGSGKSTLMKFLRDHESTDASLRKWADGHRLLVADHFFWLPGDTLQNSVEGLLRALLHDILKCLSTDLSSARTICGPKRWSLEGSRRSWSLRELKAMIMRIRSATDLRVFFFIDGLDECSPKQSHGQLIDLLLDC